MSLKNTVNVENSEGQAEVHPGLEHQQQREHQDSACVIGARNTRKQHRVDGESRPRGKKALVDLRDGEQSARGKIALSTSPLWRRMERPPSLIEIRVKLKKNTQPMIRVMYVVELVPPVPPRMTTNRK